VKRYDGDLTELVAARFSKKGLRKLDQIAAATHRDRSDVLRLLVDLAKVRPARDVRVSAVVSREPDAPADTGVRGIEDAQAEEPADEVSALG
jgi:hypothetical protein